MRHEVHSSAGLESRLLDALAGGADAPTLRGILAHALPDLPGDERRDAERRLAVVVDLLDQVDALQLRARELESLAQSVPELTALRDLDEVFLAICDRARALLSSSLAWMRVVDPTQAYPTVFAAKGAMSEAFYRLDFDPERGISARVVEQNRPFATSDYLRDPAFSHAPGLDATLAAEGVRAVACVPLRRREQIVGVLSVGDRTARRYSRNEIAQLEAFAAHAAILLENGRLFSTVQRALDDLSRAEQQARRDAAELERSFDLDERLMRLVIDGSGLEEVCRAVGEVLGGSVAVFDTQDRLIVHVAERPDALDTALAARPELVPPTLREGVSRARNAPQGVRIPGDGAGVSPRLIARLHAGSDDLGSIALARRQTEGAERLFRRAATVVTLVMAHTRDLDASEHRVRDELVADLLKARHAELPQVLRRASRLGVDLRGSAVVVVGGPGPADTAAAGARLLSAVRNHGGIAGALEGETVLVVPGDDARAVLDRLAPDSSGFTAGAAVARSPAEIADRYQEARRTLHLLLALDREGVSATTDELGFFAALFPPEGNPVVHRFVEASVGRLAATDRDRGSDLVATLGAFLGENGHLAATAKALHIHVNTLYQRLERIDKVLGPGWREADRRLELHLALRMRDVIRSLGRPPG